MRSPLRFAIRVAVLALIVTPYFVCAQCITPYSEAPLPDGGARVRFENLEGLVLFRATLHGADADTAGLMALDSGAGYLALDRPVALRLGLVDGPGRPGVDLAQRPLARLEVGALEIDYVTPLLTIDGSIVRRATDRSVLGLFGQRPLTGRAVIVDYMRAEMTIVPVPQGREESLEASRRALNPWFSDCARVIPFELAGDGKILVHGTVADPRPDRASGDLTWIVDTGATRCVLFRGTMDGVVHHADDWRAMEGLTAPTLLGDEQGRVADVPLVSLRGLDGTIDEAHVETALIGGPLGRTLSSVVDRPVHGLIGYSFLGRYRVGIDYVNQLLWLDPLPAGWEHRPHRDSQIGIQIERRGGELTVAGVVRGSPAAAAGMRIGDVLVALAGTPARLLDVASVIRRLEGPPGSSVTLTLRRGADIHTYKLLRHKLL